MSAGETGALEAVLAGHFETFEALGANHDRSFEIDPDRWLARVTTFVAQPR